MLLFVFGLAHGINGHGENYPKVFPTHNLPHWPKWIGGSRRGGEVFAMIANFTHGVNFTIGTRVFLDRKKGIAWPGAFPRI